MGTRPPVSGSMTLSQFDALANAILIPLVRETNLLELVLPIAAIRHRRLWVSSVGSAVRCGNVAAMAAFLRRIRRFPAKTDHWHP
jgi:hypothetical protein